MTTLKEYRDERLKKLDQIKALGIDPYPAKAHRTHKISEILSNFDQLEGQTVTITGRIVAIRSFGKIAFVKLRDYFGEIQIFMQQPATFSEPLGHPAGHESLGDAVSSSEEHGRFDRSETYIPDGAAGSQRMTSRTGKSLDEEDTASPKTFDLKTLNLLDLGDFIEATGTVAKTKTGEKSVFANHLRLLTKSLRPLPEKFTNKEERYRRRYVYMNVNPEVRERLVRRSKFWQATRDFMNQHGFIEINIPVLEHTTGGADATPFTTHCNAYDEDLYLRISHELPLKRLLGGGFEKVYDIGVRFRNEGVDDEHLPEHIAFEAYAAYENYEDGMNFYEEMIKYVAKETWGTLEFSVGGFSIDLDQPWPRIKYADLLREKFGVDVFNPDATQLRQILHDHGYDADPEMSIPHLIDHVWKLIRATSAGPYWLIEEPLSLSPLAKKSAANPAVTERFHPIIAGTEMGNGFSELNDPLDQLARFEEQQAARDAGDAEAQMLDRDFVEMLEYGMPPACGWGNSERNFWLLEGVPGREAVPFPLMKKLTDQPTSPAD